MYNFQVTLFPGKLRSRWSGPFTVKEIKPHGAITLISNEGNEFTVNGQRVEHYWAKAFIPNKQLYDWTFRSLISFIKRVKLMTLNK